MIQMHPQHLHIENEDLAGLEKIGVELMFWQKAINWMIGDWAAYASARNPETWHQCVPVGMSPEHVSRCQAVARAYPPDTRNPDASWSIHRNLVNDPDRVAKVAAHVENGRTSDQAREHDRAEGRWLLAVDCNLFLHKFWHSGAGIESADSVAGWIDRTVGRMKEKGLTDVVCCFDGPNNHRKELTKSWDKPYKDRAVKEPELDEQIPLLRQQLEGRGYCCVAVEGMEADDCLASAASQFDGMVVLLTSDKDMRQCLSNRVTMLTKVEWTEDEMGHREPVYHWVTAKSHLEDGVTYNSVHVTGIRPDQWCDFQCLVGDSTDHIAGAHGIGAKIAMELIQTFGTVEDAIAAAKSGDERIKPRKREALIAFEPDLPITRKLVTLKTGLSLPINTRI